MGRPPFSLSIMILSDSETCSFAIFVPFMQFKILRVLYLLEETLGFGHLCFGHLLGWYLAALRQISLSLGFSIWLLFATFCFTIYTPLPGCFPLSFLYFPIYSICWINFVVLSIAFVRKSLGTWLCSPPE